MRFANCVSEFGFKRAATLRATNVNLLGVGRGFLASDGAFAQLPPSGSAFPSAGVTLPEALFCSVGATGYSLTCRFHPRKIRHKIIDQTRGLQVRLGTD